MPTPIHLITAHRLPPPQAGPLSRVSHLVCRSHGFLNFLLNQPARFLWSDTQKSALWLSHFLSLLSWVYALDLCFEQDLGAIFRGFILFTRTTWPGSDPWLLISYLLWPVGLWEGRLSSFLCPRLNQAHEAGVSWCSMEHGLDPRPWEQ